MSLRGNPVVEAATLEDGRVLDVRVGVFDDPYIGTDSDTVGIELRNGDEVLATLNTVLDADQDAEARELAREIKRGLESAELEPTAEALEPLADQPR